MTKVDDRINWNIDTFHPSGRILFRVCQDGYADSVALSEAAMDTDAQTLAEGILLTADVSNLKALRSPPAKSLRAGRTPSAEVSTAHDLDVAIEKLLAHELHPRRDTA